MQRRLDGFTLIELIGFGGTGEVWRARPDGGGTEVALKWLTAETVDTEVLSGSRLRDFEHPHVARLLDLRRDRSSVVLVQQLISGVSLAALLSQRERLGSAEVVTLLTPVAEALGAAHDAGVLHGNLTPNAILVTPDGRPMVTDLGVWESVGAPASGPARLEYLDPSVARGGAVTTASDVFAVAAIGFRALTGRPPWTASHDAGAWELAAEGSGVDLRPLHASTPSVLADVIARGLSEQPRLRGSAQAFATDIRAALEPQPLHLAGPYEWPDLPSPPAGGDVLEVTGLDIAGEVRRGGSARPVDGTPGSARHAVPRNARRVVPRRAVVGALVALVILSVIVLGLGWNASKAVPAQAGGPIGSVSGPAGAAESGTDRVDERALPASDEAWLDLLSLLYDRRALAFGTGATALLAQVFTPDSPQLVADAAELARLADAGQVLRGFSPRVSEVLEVSVEGDRATLRLTDEFAGYQTVPATDTRAAPLADHTGRGPTEVTMTLVLTEAGWRIQAAQRLA